jgi:hypothetical protein
MDHEDEARAKELIGLRLALAAFAVQLDLFEARIRDRRTKPSLGPLGIQPNRGFANQIIAAMKSSPGDKRTEDV